MTWRELAACDGADIEIFFPNVCGGPYKSSIYNQARAICASCTVRTECLEDAVDIGNEGPGWRFGFRGGMTPSDRDRLMRGVRWCWTCGAKFTTTITSEHHCSDECRAQRKRDQQNGYYARSKVA